MKPEIDIFPWGPLTIKSTIDQEFIDLLKEKGDEARAQNNDLRKTLAGQMDYEYYYKDYAEWFMPLLDPYMSAWLMKAVERTSFQLMENPITGYNCYSLWINYQQSYEYNPPHNHGGDVSFIIYLQVPEEILKENKETRLEHNNPGPGVVCFSLGPELPFSITQAGFMPTAGDIVIFPAWLFHHVNAFKSNVERISVSGNIKIKTVDFDTLPRWKD